MSGKTFEDYLLAEIASGVHFAEVGGYRGRPSNRDSSEITGAFDATRIMTKAVCSALGHRWIGHEESGYLCVRCRMKDGAK